VPRPLQWLSARTGIERGELRWAAWFAAALMAATCLPYLFGIAATPPESRYMGFLSNPDEHNVYMGWMRQAMEGRWLFKDPFTTESQPGAGFFNVFFLALGWVARALHVEPIWPYHGARLIFGFLLLVTAYVFAARYCRTVLARRLALGLVGLSSGFGWIYALLRPDAAVHPLDYGRHLVLPEAITFLSLLLNPLFAASMWLILATYLLLLRAWDTGSRKALLGASLAALFLANIHTYDVLVIWCVLAAMVLVRGAMQRRLPWREAWMAAVVVAVSVWPVIYQVAFFQADPVFQAKALTKALTPPGRYVALGLGLPLLLAIPGAAVAARRRLVLPVVWVAVNWLLVAYAPFSFQRKMIEGMHLPICVLAAAFVGDCLLARRWRGAGAVALAVVVLSLPSNAFFVRQAGHNLLTNNREYLHVLMPPLYLSDDEFAAMRWLRENTRSDEAVLSTNLTGSYIPGVAGNFVFVGHWAETIHYKRRLGETLDFLSPATSDGFRIALARRHSLRYLFYGPRERAVGGFDPEASPRMTRVHRVGRVSTYRLDYPLY